jgi:hypothetical protein
MGWATTDEVSSITGVTVSDSELALAAATIEAHSGRPHTEDIAGVTGTRDTYRLKRAEAFQAVWLQAQPDLLKRLNVTTVPGDGGATQLGEDALTLAPYARLFIGKLSWKRSRSVRTRPAVGVGRDFTVSDNHDFYPLRVTF